MDEILSQLMSELTFHGAMGNTETEKQEWKIRKMGPLEK